VIRQWRYASLIGTAALLVVSTRSLHAATWQVRQDGTGDFTTLGAAVAVASAGDVIGIGPGTYPEHLTITVGLSLVSTDGPETTVLDGTNAGRIIWFNGALGSSVSALTFTGGFADAGGAVLVSAGGSLLITNSVFGHNFSSHDGGAVFCSDPGTGLQVEDCEFHHNSAAWNCGAAGATMQSLASFAHCLFRENSAGALSAGVANFADSPLRVEYCLFVHNSAQVAGAILIQDSSAVVRNNTFFEDLSGADDGATVNFYTGYSRVFEYNIVTADLAGCGARLLNDPVHDCNILFANAAGPLLNGNLSSNEFIVDPLFCDYTEDDFTLCVDSIALPENNGCGMMGACGQGCTECGPVATETVSWGALKRSYQ
jgi:hypothetical protein